MDQVDFLCDDGTSSLTRQDRHPADRVLPAKSFRLRVQCADCVAGITVDAESFASFIRLLNFPCQHLHSQTQWTSPAGEWQLTIQRTETGYRFRSHIDSLLDTHRWKLDLYFDMSDTSAKSLAENLRTFIGTYQ